MKMRAGIYKGIKDVELEEIDKPELLKGSIIVKNVRAGICGTDLHAYNVDGPGVGIYPNNQFGHEMAGIVDEVGEGVTDFKVGDHVFINPCTFKEPTEDMSLLMCCDMAGAFSEYVRVDKPVKDYNVFKLPEGMSWDIAALTEPVSVALNVILKCNPKEGDKVVIYGGGIIGLCALASLQSMGIKDVIVVERIPFRCQKVEEMGGIVCDTTKVQAPDFIKEQWGKETDNNGDETWNADVVIDAAGYKGSFTEIFNNSKAGSHIGVVALGTSTEEITGAELCYKDANIYGSFAYTPEVNKQVLNMTSSHSEKFEPIITNIYGLSDISYAFQQAADSDKNVKVLIDHSK